jgi:hypothetical protein
MPSPAQLKFFDNLLEGREFPPKKKVDELREQFAELDDTSASAWIEAALKLPKRSDGGVISTPAPF